MCRAYISPVAATGSVQLLNVLTLEMKPVHLKLFFSVFIQMLSFILSYEASYLVVLFTICDISVLFQGSNSSRSQTEGSFFKYSNASLPSF